MFDCVDAMVQELEDFKALCKYGDATVDSQRALQLVEALEKQIVCALSNGAYYNAWTNKERDKLNAEIKSLESKLDRREPLRADELDVVGSLFGVRHVPGTQGLVEIYIENYENYHHKMTFNRTWLSDLISVAKEAQQ